MTRALDSHMKAIADSESNKAYSSVSSRLPGIEALKELGHSMLETGTVPGFAVPVSPPSTPVDVSPPQTRPVSLDSSARSSQTSSGSTRRSSVATRSTAPSAPSAVNPAPKSQKSPQMTARSVSTDTERQKDNVEGAKAAAQVDVASISELEAIPVVIEVADGRQREVVARISRDVKLNIISIATVRQMGKEIQPLSEPEGSVMTRFGHGTPTKSLGKVTLRCTSSQGRTGIHVHFHVCDYHQHLIILGREVIRQRPRVLNRKKSTT